MSSSPSSPDLRVAVVSLPERLVQPPKRDVKVSLTKLDEGLARWSRVVKRFQRKRRRTIAADQSIEIVSSVFPHVDSDPFRSTELNRTLDDGPPTTAAEFQRVVDAVQRAIEAGVHPRMNAKGSSGSYLVKDESGTTVGVFKPAKEHPYGELNPKWAKRAQRATIGRLIGFGRGCLVLNFSYLSEVGASLIDRRLGIHIVPRTEVSSFSSPAFFYDYIDRAAASRKHKPKPLPPKTGSLQLFAQGFTDASDFFKAHPWPGKAVEDPDAHRHRRRRRSCWASCCGRAEDFGEGDEGPSGKQADEPFVWTEELMSDLRQELEKLVILDYLIRNTDRGLDNFMLKVDQAKSRVHLCAIDNSLAFPFEHPQGWRSYAFGWLWLPATLVGRPFSPQTRQHFLPLLSSSKWWSETTRDLRMLFSADDGWSATTFDKQMAVLKGQGLNIVRSLLDDSEGPLELCRRDRLLVWDDRIELSSAEALTPPAALDIAVPSMQEATESTPLLSASLPSLPAADLHRRPSIDQKTGWQQLDDLERRERKAGPSRPAQLRRSTTAQHVRSSSASMHLPTPPRPQHARVASSERRPRQWASLAGNDEEAEPAELEDRIVVIEREQTVGETAWCNF